MKDEQLQTLEQVVRFVEGSRKVEFERVNPKEKYKWMEEVLKKFRYFRLRKGGKGLIMRYIIKVSGYYRVQVTRLIGKYQETSKIKLVEYHRHRFPRKYNDVEVSLLARTDELHGWLSGPATRKILEVKYAAKVLPLDSQSYFH